LPHIPNIHFGARHLPQVATARASPPMLRYALPVRSAGVLHRAVLVRAEDFLQAVLRLHLGTERRGAEGDGEGPL